MITHFNPDPFTERCNKMIDLQIRNRGILEPRILQTMKEIPRDRFLPPELRPHAYDDQALPIGQGQTISQPYIVAYMTEQLDLQPTSRVLEIGTGTGYQTAILAKLSAHVYSVERIPDLQQNARDLLTSLGINNVSYHVADGTLGWPDHAPYDRILVTASAAHIPRPLLDQLAPDGLLIMPVGGTDEQTILRATRKSGRTIETPLLPCRFVKLIGQQGWTNES
ncbi:MAG: protein-L-isoaspartate(D-aspartate) O-methyltransferase [Planctomycetota bacterium]